MALPLEENALPPSILSRATRRGNEYAWPIETIPEVIEAARANALVNIGGQLQFRFADGAVCECYWVAVDTFLAVPSSLPWNDRVEQTAAVALASFSAVKSECDFLEEGRKAFGDIFLEYDATGESPESAMCFVWYLASDNSDSAEA